MSPAPRRAAAPLPLSPLLFISIIIIIAAATDLVHSLTPDESQAMTDLLNNLGAVAAANGSSASDPCTWSTIRCDDQHVTAIYIKNNPLSGKTLPPTLSNLKYLTDLHLQSNNLTGALPSLKGFNSLKKLYLTDNNFNSVPADCFDGMGSLQEFSIDQNPTLAAWQIPQGLSGSTALSSFSADNANITGTIPGFFGKLPSLVKLSLSSNNLQGGLPDEFAGSNIQSLYLNGQNLSGEISVLQNMTALADVRLNLNKFTGPLPDFSGLTALQNISLRDNKLTGPVPDSLINLPQLKNVALGNNNLQGPTPKFGQGVSVDKTGGNQFCTNIEGSQCDPLVNTLLSILKPWKYPLFFATNWAGNNPCSSPPWLGITCSGSDVIRVDLSSRNLSGTISSDFSLLTSLQYLDLSNNNLTGKIPAELTQLAQLKEIDVSNNNLCGGRPSFPSHVTVKMGGNPDIEKDCKSSVPGGQGDQSGSHRHKKSALIVILPVCSCIAFAIVVLLIVIRRRRKSKSKHSQKGRNPNSLLLDPWPDQDGGKNTTSQPRKDGGGSGPSNNHVIHVEEMNLIISIEVLEEATNNFSKENILGKGGFGTVYKGELPDGTKIAVKRMETGQGSNKGLDEFTSEISVLTRVRHRHLVSLLGYCLHGGERLLAYEYLPQGTLSRFLFHWKEEGIKPLEWARRLAIALDVARGVEYLHTLANQTFIHRDLKPSNILLGDNMRAKVADFGLVRLVPDDKASFNTRLAGTFGYLAPEYAVTGRVTTKVDVYSFGVILMEIITGRKAIDESKPEESMHLVPWFRRMHISRDTFPKAIDPMIQQDEETLVSISKVAELAVHCSAREPHQRPDMNHAVNVLHSLAEFWKPSETETEDGDGIDLDTPLPEALRRWQAFEDDSYSSSLSTAPGSADNTQSPIPVAPPMFASMKSTDGR